MDATVRAWRCRADALRVLAARLEATPLLGLDAAAGPDTWVCPVADAFLAGVYHYQHEVLAAAEELRWAAWQLDRQADELEAQARALAAAGAT